MSTAVTPGYNRLIDGSERLNIELEGWTLLLFYTYSNQNITKKMHWSSGKKRSLQTVCPWFDSCWRTKNTNISRDTKWISTPAYPSFHLFFNCILFLTFHFHLLINFSTIQTNIQILYKVISQNFYFSFIKSYLKLWI